MPVSAHSIASKIKSLRTERRWTQAELASKLSLSQSRLSELERGAGSFTAEQFIEVLRLFNVTVRDFDPAGSVRDSEDDLQQALARYGANYLVEPDAIIPTEQLADLHELVVSTLVTASPRLVAALVPVLIVNVDRIHLQLVADRLRTLGLQNRLYWLIDNALAAIAAPHLRKPRLQHRCHVVWSSLIALAPTPDPMSRDILDRTIRSTTTLEKVATASTDIARRWGVVTAMAVGDFVEAIELSHVLD